MCLRISYPCMIVPYFPDKNNHCGSCSAFPLSKEDKLIIVIFYSIFPRKTRNAFAHLLMQNSSRQEIIALISLETSSDFILWKKRRNLWVQSMHKDNEALLCRLNSFFCDLEVANLSHQEKSGVPLMFLSWTKKKNKGN